jgi:hypothetical protein
MKEIVQSMRRRINKAFLPGLQTVPADPVLKVEEKFLKGNFLPTADLTIGRY